LKIPFSQYFQRKAAGASAVSFDTMNHQMLAATFGGMSTKSGKSITMDSALTISAAWACMRVLTETTGSLPWKVYQRNPSTKATIERPDHWLSDLIERPNADQTPVEFKESAMLGLCREGNSYALTDRLSNRVISAYPVNPSAVRPMRKRGTNTRLNLAEGETFFRYTETGGTTQDYSRNEMWQIKGFGSDPLQGISPVAAAREAMGVAASTEEFGARFFAQGGKPSGIATIPNFLTKEQRVIARENLQQMLGGMSNAHKFALFEGGIKPEPWGDNALKDMEFLLLRQFSVLEICRFYRVPPHMVADLSRATFSNIEHLSLEFVQFTLMPYFTRIESSVARWLLTPQDRADGIYLRFNFEGLLRGDSAGRSALYTQSLQSGWMTRNEVRIKENLDPSDKDGMDDFTVQAQMIGIDDMGTESAAPPAPRGKPKPAPVEDSSDNDGDKLYHSPFARKEMDDMHIHVNVGNHAVDASGASSTEQARIEALVKQQVAIATQSMKIDNTLAEAALCTELGKASVETIAAAERAIAQANDALLEMKRLAAMPRKVVFDKDGEPIGTVPVEELPQ
jgi:HK97 family phage portal protein